ncbi:hypothetical protein H632_c402p0, partial [Helicosporidium sp. ATCC 50920]
GFSRWLMALAPAPQRALREKGPARREQLFRPAPQTSPREPVPRPRDWPHTDAFHHAGDRERAGGERGPDLGREPSRRQARLVLFNQGGASGQGGPPSGQDGPPPGQDGPPSGQGGPPPGQGGPTSGQGAVSAGAAEPSRGQVQSLLFRRRGGSGPAA